MADARSAAEILAELGHCPVKRLAELSDAGEINDFQRASIEKWLMEVVHAKPTKTELSGEIGISTIERKIVDA